MVLAMMCSVVIAPGNTLVLAQNAVPAAPTAATTTQTPAIPSDQLDSLVAPIALYPDPLLAQTLAASTYPLELMQLQQWIVKHSTLTGQPLFDAVSKQPWDATVQAMAPLPDLVKRLTDDIQWTTDLGNAFLAQQADVMAAVQRMRQKAQMKGTLTSTAQQTVETQVVESKSVIVIEQASPQVVYVPSYDPVLVYGAPLYPYPPIYYPPAGYAVAGAAIGFGVGVAMGAAWGGGWGWNAGWGRGDIDVNYNNNFNRNTNVNRSNINGNGNWQHQGQHRGAAPYANRATADRFGGAARGDATANRQSAARQQLSTQGGLRSNGAVGTSGQFGGGQFANRAGGASASGDRIGNRSVAGSGGAGGALGGGSDRFSGSSARASSSRGSSSVRSSGGGSRSGSFGGGGGRSRGGGGGGGRRR